METRLRSDHFMLLLFAGSGAWRRDFAYIFDRVMTVSTCLPPVRVTCVGNLREVRFLAVISCMPWIKGVPHRVACRHLYWVLIQLLRFNFLQLWSRVSLGNGWGGWELVFKLIHHTLDCVHISIGNFSLHYLSVHLRISVNVVDTDLRQSDWLRRFLL